MSTCGSMKMFTLAAFVAGSLAAVAGEYVWSGGGVAGKWDDSANWGDAGVPAAGDTAVFNGSANITSDFSVGAGDKIVIQANAGATVNFTGAISGSAPIELGGAGTIGFGGANTFTGALEVKVVTFNANSDGAFGSADAGTTFRAWSGSGSKWTFNGITTSEAISIDNNGGQTDLFFPANMTNVFNGAWKLLAEQYRGTVGLNGYVRFNADFANDIGYMTLTLNSGSVLDFNCAMSGNGGPPRLISTGSVIYRKPVTFKTPGYGFFYNSSGTHHFLCDNVLGTGTSSTPMTTHNAKGYTATVDLHGHDLDVACLVAYSTDITSSEGEATLHVYNSCDPTGGSYGNSGNYEGKIKGPVSVSVEGNSKLAALTLCSVSESTGTLTVRNGGKAVFTGSGKWGTGGAVIGSGSSIEVVNSETFGARSSIEVAAGGTIVIPSGVLQTVKNLTLGDITGENGKTYGSLETTANVDVKSACISGDGVIAVVNGQTLSWKGPAGGKWSVAENWEPNGVPDSGDVLNFDASAAAVSSENDLTGVTLTGINFSGANEIVVTGNKVSLGNRATISAAGCSGGIAFGLPFETTGADGAVISSTKVGGAVSTWTFTGAWSGSSRVTFDGDHTGVYNFKQQSPAFDGELWLSNAGAYHLYEALALGSTVGYTRYEVRQGTYESNGGATREPFYFHGIDTAEDFYLAGFSTFSFHFAEGTENVLRGAIDTPKDRYVTAQPNVERFRAFANAKVTISGKVGAKTRPNCDSFEIILFYGDAGSSTVLDSTWDSSSIRAYPADGAEFVLNKPQTKVGYVGLFDRGTLRLGCDHAFGEDGSVSFYCGYNNSTYHSTFDLAGHVVEMANLVWYGSVRDQLKYIEFADSVGVGELKFMNPAGDKGDFVSCVGSGVKVAMASSGEHLFNPKACGTGVTLAIENGASVALPAEAALPLAKVEVDGASTFRLASNSSLSTILALDIAANGTADLASSVDLTVSSLTIGGVPQAVGYSYGSSASGADVKNACFSGTGVVRMPGTIVADVHVWKGPADGKWSANENWEPAGPIGFGNVLVFDSTAGAVSSENDLDLVKISGIRLKGDNPIQLSGKTCRIVAGGMGMQGEEGSLATVDFALPLNLVRESVQPIPYVAASGQVFRVTGAISGAADIVFGGGGAIELRADNAFTGVLTMTNGVLDVYADGAFGTADGKTVIRIPDAVPAGCRAPAVTFHGVTTSEPIEWKQTYGDYAGYFPAATTNVFNGTLKGIGGQPRWYMSKDAALIINGASSGFAAFTLMTEAGARYDQNGTYDGSYLRFSGKGELYLAGKCTFNGIGYSILHNTGTPRLTFLGDNLLAQKDNDIKYTPLALGVGTADLNGHTQQILSLCGRAGTTVTNSGERTELRAMMYYNYRASFDNNTFVIDHFDGSICGPVDFTVEGSAMPTQYLGGVSTSTGALTVKNGGTVCIDKGGSWSGEVNVQADSKLVFADHASFGRRTTLRLSGNGQVVLNSDENVRCRELYIDGVAATPGTYSAATDSVHFAGAGSVRVTGLGSLILVR